MSNAVILTADEVGQLQGLVATANAGNQNQTGLWASAYNTLAADLTTTYAGVDGSPAELQMTGLIPPCGCGFPAPSISSHRQPTN